MKRYEGAKSTSKAAGNANVQNEIEVLYCNSPRRTAVSINGLQASFTGLQEDLTIESSIHP